jgi:hypothetical protein
MALASPASARQIYNLCDIALERRFGILHSTRSHIRRQRVRFQQFWLFPHWPLEARLDIGSRMNGDIHVRI